MNRCRLLFYIMVLVLVYNCFAVGETFTVPIGFDFMWGSQLSSNREEPRDCYELKANTLVIKKELFGLTCTFYSRALRPSSKNTVSFQVRATERNEARLKAFITFSASHDLDEEQCNGTTEKRVFDLSCTVGKEFRTFNFPLVLNAADLKCRQCGRALHAGRFFLSAYLDRFAKNENGSGGTGGGLELSPFSLTMEFPVAVTDRKHISSTFWLTDIRNPPKKTAVASSLSRKRVERRKTAGQVVDVRKIQEERTSFQAVLDLLDRGDEPAAVAEAVRIGEKNHFAAIFLYLAYSRGYNGVAIDYSLAARYFSSFIGSFSGIRTPGFMFYLSEYEGVWKKYRLPPTVPGERVTILTWGRGYSCMEEIVPLRGTRPLKECYEERMRNIGGTGARVLYLIGREQAEPIRSELMKMARERGSAEAWADPFTPYEARVRNDVWELKNEGMVGISFEKFQELQHAAELGYVPAKLMVAKLFLKNSFDIPPDAGRARKLIQEAIATCEKTAESGCPHSRTDLSYARELQNVIPDEEAPTAELLRQWSAIHSSGNSTSHVNSLTLSVLNHLLSHREDNPDRGFFQAMYLPATRSDLQKKLLREAAEQGGHLAIRACLSRSFGQRDHWYYLYLAGKAGLSGQGETPESYFRKAYARLKERAILGGEEYVRNLSLLAPFNKDARLEYERVTFCPEFKLESSEPETLSGTLEKFSGRWVVKVLAKPSEKTRYLNISLEREQGGSVSLSSSSAEISNGQVRLEYPDSNGKPSYMKVNTYSSMTVIPKKMKLVICPRQQPLELIIIPDLPRR